MGGPKEKLPICGGGGGGGGYTIYMSGSYCFQYHYACITRPFRLKRMSAPL